MEWLNYHHFYYFWVVAQEGGFAPAGRKLRISHSTIKAQVAQLESYLGETLFEREGRGVVLTEAGRVAQRYAESIFHLGQEFLGVMRGHVNPVERRLRLAATHVVPKLLVRKLVDPVIEAHPEAQMSFSEGSSEHLIAGLATHEYDVVITDTPMPPGSSVKAYNHRLLGSGVSFLASGSLTPRLRRRFPRSLEEVPLLMPSRASTIRGVVEDWFRQNDLRPLIRYEFDDTALLKVFGEEALGIFPVPTVIEKAAMEQTHSTLVGRAKSAHVSFFALSVERRIRHPLVLCLTEAAKSRGPKGGERP